MSEQDGWLFVYGALATAGWAADRLRPFEAGRIGGTARGRIVEREYGPAAEFDVRSTEFVRGEVVQLKPNVSTEALIELDELEAPLFRRVIVRVQTDRGDRITAYAYEWNGMWVEYVEAVRRKVAVAHYHLRILQGVQQETSIQLQAHFEGLLYSVDAAADQLEQALTKEMAVRGSDLLEELKTKLRLWNARPLRDDARKLRDRATHHHYGKSPAGPGIIVEPVQSGYEGSRDLLDYSSALVVDLEALTEIGRAFEAEMRRVSG